MGYVSVYGDYTGGKPDSITYKCTDFFLQGSRHVRSFHALCRGFQLVEIILLSSCILCTFSCYVSGVVSSLASIPG